MAEYSDSELTTEQIWAVQEGERRPVRLTHVALFALLILAGFLVGAFGSISVPMGFGVNFFWTGIVVQQVGAIWFGGWGVLAAGIFPFFSNAVAGGSFVVSLAFLPANLIQAFLPAWVFRRFKLDPRLNSWRDYVVLLASMIISSLLGALWSTLVVLRSLELVTADSIPLFFFGWLVGNLAAGIVFNFLILRTVSGMVIRTAAFVKRWWS